MLRCIEVLKDCFVILTNITALITFIIGFEAIKYRLDVDTRKLYLENYLNMQSILDKIIRTSQITTDEINKIAVAKQNAQIYLDDRTIFLIDKIHNLSTDLFLINQSCPTNKEEILKLKEILKSLGEYKAFGLVKHYRKYIVCTYRKWFEQLLYFCKFLFVKM